MGSLMAWFVDFVEWITGRKARREERDAYMAALQSVTQASMEQSKMLSAWFQSMAAASAPQKGWTQTDREQALDEILQERPALAAKIPETIKGDYTAIEQWMNEELLSI